MVYSKRTQRSLDEIDVRLREAAQRHKFGVLNVQDLRSTLKGKGIELGADCRVYDVCNPQAATEALHHDMSISTVLPCRISVFSDPRGRTIATLKPTDLLGATGLKGIEGVASQVEREILAIVDESA